MAGPSTLYQAGDHASRPANGAGCVLYSCTDHDLVYRDDGTSWATYMTLVGGSGGDVATDAIWDAAGDIAVGSGANTAARLAIGAANTVPKSNGTTLAYALPPSHEFDYVQWTAGLFSPTATTEATADVFITGSSVTYDGSTSIMIEGFSPLWSANPATGNAIVCVLWDDTANVSLGKIAFKSSQAANTGYEPMIARRRLTPASGARVYSLRIYGNGGQVIGGAGGVGEYVPAFIRITKA